MGLCHLHDSQLQKRRPLAGPWLQKCCRGHACQHLLQTLQLSLGGEWILQCKCLSVPHPGHSMQAGLGPRPWDLAELLCTLS